MSGIDSSSDSVAFDSYSDPFSLFGAWFDEARRVETGEAHADDIREMVLATADAEGRVSSRVVLLKDWGRGGFVFFTNYSSRKARALGENPSAALLFHWRVLGRQVRIEGSVVRASSEVSDAYFASRPLSARLGAWASRQSEVLASREVLENRLAEQAKRWGEAEQKYGQKYEIARPDFWGGFVLRAERFEFWCDGGDSRLHDRFVFEEREGKFTKNRLYP